MGKHSKFDAPSRRPVVIGSAVVLVAAALFGASRLGGSGGLPSAGPSSVSSSATTTTSTTSTASSPSSTEATPATSSSTTSAAEAAALSALNGCVTRQAAAQPVVESAKVGTGHWRAHLEGQNDIESGKHTLAEVRANTWTPTNAAGPADVTAFDSALTAYAAVNGCVDADKVPAIGDLQAKLAACASRQAALDGYVQAAKDAMTDWRTHLDEMAQHASGQVDSIHAQDVWIRAWRNAPTHLAPYDAATSGLASVPPCSS